MHCFGWNNCSYLKQPLSKMEVFFLMSNSRLYPGLELPLEHTSVRRNLFLSASFCWDSRLSLREMDQKFNFSGAIVYGDSYLEFWFCHSKLFLPHVTLEDAAEVLRLSSGDGPGYCYIIGRGPNSCMLGHLTGLVFRFYIKFFLPSIFKSVDFGSVCLASY